MNLPIIFMYSGQGSQYYQMGRNLFDENITFKNALLNADKIYNEITGSSILSVLYDEAFRNQPLSQTLVAHPAIFMIEYALTEALRAKHIVPDMVLGTSLGEFVAAVVAGVINFESALYAVIKQAEFLERCPTGGMLAILDTPSLYQSQAYLYENSELAAINFNSHFLVAGSNEKLQFIIKKLNENNILSQMVTVSRPFHSSVIDSAKEPFLNSIENLVINDPTLPYISCEKGGILHSIKNDHFWNIARKPILFQSAIEQLEKMQPAIYIDLGPSGTLATFVKYNLLPGSQSSQYAILTPFANDIKNLETVSNLLIIRK